MFSLSKSEAGFSALPEDSENCVEHDQMLKHHTYDEERNLPRNKRFWSSNLPWVVTTIALSIYILASSVYYKRTTGVCENPTDLPLFRPLVEESFRTMTAGLDYHNENHTLQSTPAPGPRYVGPPTPEIDAAWMDLAGMQEIYLTREEAEAVGVADTFMDPLTNLYEVEVESFHHLHCLNYIRKSIDFDHYPDMQDQADTWRLHLGHCIDTIREFIMCKADMTPIVLVPPGKSDAPVPVPEFRTRHMCRDYGKLKDWAKAERNANGSKEGKLRIAEMIRKKTGTKY